MVNYFFAGRIEFLNIFRWSLILKNHLYALLLQQYTNMNKRLCFREISLEKERGIWQVLCEITLW